MKRFSLLVVAVAFAGVSCERHDFEGPDGTKQLHEHHASASHGATDHESPSEHAEKKGEP